MKENKERMINYENKMSEKKNKLNSNLNQAEKNYNRLTKDLIPKLEEYNIFLRKKIKEERDTLKKEIEETPLRKRGRPKKETIADKPVERRVTESTPAGRRTSGNAYKVVKQAETKSAE